MNVVGRRLTVGVLIALFVAGLMPATALAVVPVASPDSVSTPEDTAKLITLVGTDGDGHALTFAISSAPTHGGLSGIGAPDCIGIPLTCSADVTYTPNQYYNGPDAFIFTVDDGLDLSSATITITVDSVNNAPVGTNKTITMLEDTAHVFTEADFGFTDPNDTPADTFLSARITTLPGVGSLKNNNIAVSAGTFISLADIVAGKLIFTPVANANGTGYTTFTFQVKDDGTTANGGIDLDPTAATFTLNVTAVNDPPVANDDTKTINEDSGLGVVAVLANDTDVDGPSKTVISKTNPAHGTLTLVAGVLSYTPGPDYNGQDSFGYTMSDGTFDSTATVTITVLPINDPPVANDDTVNLNEDPGATILNVKGNDTDVDGDALTVTSKTDPTHGTLTLVAGVLTYTPTLNYNGPDGFTYTISDGEFTDGGTVGITITAQNDAPVAVDDVQTIVRDSAATVVAVLANDSDVELDPLLIIAKTTAAKGTVVITGGGTGLTYDPFTGFSGADSFTYTISDGHGGTATATVTLNIAGNDRAPNAVNDVSFSVPEGATATSLDVLANDDDPDGDTFSIVGKTNGAHGMVTIGAGGAGLTYDPVPLFHGTDTFTYTIKAGGLTDTATVVVTVTKDTTAPIVVAPAQRFLGGTVGTSTIKARITWYATDTASGIKSYLIQESVNGAAYVTVTPITPTRNYIDRVLTSGKSYHYRVRATDKEGNVSGWRYTNTFKPAIFQETTGLAKYVGAWSTYRTTAALGGTVRYTPTLGKTVKFTYTVYDVALVMTKTATSGSADIYVDDVLVRRVNLRATSTIYRQLVFTKHFAILGAHTVEIRPIGTGRVDIDAFPVLR